MYNDALNELLIEIDNLWKKLTLCRAYFPHTPKDLVGASGLFAAPYYDQYGHKVSMYSDAPLTQDDVSRMNEVGHHMNQNFIIRLLALLDSRSILSDNIDQELTGWNDLDILRRLRNVFAHTTGKLDTGDPKQVRLNKRINEYYNLSLTDPDDFTLSIDTVLQPMFEGCKGYVKSKMENMAE